jgi:hypothetical protein
MKTSKPKPNAYRTLKIELVGDRFRKETCPKIRLQGKWLEKAGFEPERHVQVILIAPGTMLLHRIRAKSSKDALLVAFWRKGRSLA